MKEPLLVKFLKRAFPHRFFVAKLSNVPIFKEVIDHMLFDGDNMIYLPKDQVVQMDQPPDNLGEMVLPSQVVEHFIEKANYHWFVHICLCRKLILLHMVNRGPQTRHLGFPLLFLLT